MQIALPPGEDYAVTVQYEQGLAERIGVTISILGLAAFLGIAARGLARAVTATRRRI